MGPHAATKPTQPIMFRTARRGGNIAECVGQLTPSFFCRLEDDVVYWNTSRLSG